MFYWLIWSTLMFLAGLAIAASGSGGNSLMVPLGLILTTLAGIGSTLDRIREAIETIERSSRASGRPGTGGKQE